MSNNTSDRYRIKRRVDDEICSICGREVKMRYDSFGRIDEYKRPYYIHIRGDFQTDEETITVCYNCKKKRGGLVDTHYRGYENSDRYLGLRQD